MKQLITSQEVAEIAFGGEENICIEFVSSATIIAAQRRYIQPVVGEELWLAIEQGKYPDFVTQWLAPALAMYVKYAVLPSIAAQSGVMGVVRYNTAGFTPADDKTLARLIKRTRMDADTLIDAAIEFIETSVRLFPEYDFRNNVRNSISMIGGIVL